MRRRVSAPGLPADPAGADFIAIDFETANTHRSSACAIGVAIVRNGHVDAHGSALINPETEFSPYNSAITGIHPEDVADAPTFDALWPALANLLEGQTVVAHVATFDIGVLRQAVAKCGMPGIDMNVLCSWRLARRIWPDYPAFGLSYLSGELDLDLDHHEAGSDAAACAEVVLAAQRSAGASDQNDLRSRIDMPLGSLSADSFVGVDADFVEFADGHQTGKMKRAAKLKSDGEEIEIVSERDFLALL